MADLTGRRAIVTGGVLGVGQGIAHALAEVPLGYVGDGETDVGQSYLR